MEKQKLCFHIGYSVLGETNYGSEISLINLCRELKNFYNITIFSLNLPVRENLIDNFLVQKNALTFDEEIKNNKVDILVISRYLNPFIYHDLHNVSKIFLWSHDIGFQSAFEGKIMRDEGKHFLKNIQDKIKGIVCLTNFHTELMKNHYGLDKTPFYTIGHGLNENEDDNKIQKVKHRFIYTSYPNRGLDFLLKIFPLIREEFGDAELHIYRDESTFSETQNEVINMCSDYIKKKGYAPNTEIQKAFQEAEVWLYPTNYVETFCISAIEAQSAGCLCITSALGALNETVDDRGVLINECQYGSKEYIEKVLKSVRIFFNSNLYDNKIARAKEWARSKSWKSVANSWREIIN
jgi:glycosyltransferase involved in cell wall biosynthesis